LALEDFSSSGRVEGDFWYEDPVCEAWKSGHMITINVTAIYKIDPAAGQVAFTYWAS